MVNSASRPPGRSRSAMSGNSSSGGVKWSAPNTDSTASTGRRDREVHRRLGTDVGRPGNVAPAGSRPLDLRWSGVEADRLGATGGEIRRGVAGAAAEFQHAPAVDVAEDLGAGPEAGDLRPRRADGVR